MRWILCVAALVSSFSMIEPREAEAGGAMIRALADKHREREPLSEKLRHARAMQGPRRGAGGASGGGGCGPGGC